MNISLAKLLSWRSNGYSPNAGLPAVRQSAPNVRSIEDIAADEEFGGLTNSGVAVTGKTAMQVSAVLCCMRVLAEGVAQLPYKLLRTEMVPESNRPAKIEVRDHQAYRRLAIRPNQWQTPFEFREMMMLFAVLEGTGIALKTGEPGDIRELIPIMPGHWEVQQLPNFELSYTLRNYRGETIATGVPMSRIFQIRGPGVNGVVGLEIWRLAREAIGLAMAGETAQAKLHSNGNRTPGIISTEQSLSADQVGKIRENFNKMQSGLRNAYRIAVLDAGMKFNSLAVTPEDAQALENRRMQVEEICRFMRVFPQMVMQADKTASYASSEQFFQAHVIHSLLPWVIRFEQAADRDLVSEEDLNSKLNLNSLLRGTVKDRGEYYSKMAQLGIYTRNEIRAFEEMNPLPGLDAPLTPLNLGPTADDEGANDGETT